MFNFNYFINPEPIIKIINNANGHRIIYVEIPSIDEVGFGRLDIKFFEKVKEKVKDMEVKMPTN